MFQLIGVYIICTGNSFSNTADYPYNILIAPSGNILNPKSSQSSFEKLHKICDRVCGHLVAQKLPSFFK